MEKNSVSLKEVLTLGARRFVRAFDVDDAANTRRDPDDVRKSQTPSCQHQRSAGISGLFAIRDDAVFELSAVTPTHDGAQNRGSLTLSRKTWQQNYFWGHGSKPSSALAKRAGLHESPLPIRRPSRLRERHFGRSNASRF
jgi:hypothetical protein